METQWRTEWRRDAVIQELTDRLAKMTVQSQEEKDLLKLQLQQEEDALIQSHSLPCTQSTDRRASKV